MDPGKNNLLFMMNNAGKYFRYSNRERLYETKRLKYMNTLQKNRDKKGITEIENKLSKYDSKECDIKKFKEYINELFVRDATGKKITIHKVPVRDITGKIVMKYPAKSRSSKR